MPITAVVNNSFYADGVLAPGSIFQLFMNSHAVLCMLRIWILI